MMRPTALACGLVLVVSAEASAANLTLSKGPGAGEVTLAWTGAVGRSEIYRSESPSSLLDPFNKIAFVAGSSFTDYPDPTSSVFYEVVDGFGTLLFSEYVEGSSFNKALEIKNTTSGTFDLTGCSIRTFANGSPTSGVPLSLDSIAIASGDVFVICNSSASAALQSQCDLLTTSTALGFNGDDAVQLFCGSESLDVIGQIGFDPGTEWGTSPNATRDATLRRRCAVAVGDADGSDVFDPAATAWLGLPVDTFSGLGDPTCAP